MKTQPIDSYATAMPRGKAAAVHHGAKAGHEKRTQVLFDAYPQANDLRALAGRVKQHAIENLDTLLPQAEERLKANGAHVHWAATAEDACAAVWAIMQQRGARRMVKSKTMVSEEIHLTAYLEKRGATALETDLGEFIVQIDGDIPSHVVKPILHKSRHEIAASFERHGLGAYDSDPETITRRARAHLRDQYISADVALTGANFLVAESGRIVIVTNEGNSRFCVARAPVHIALIGIEKILPRDRDLPLLLGLLGRSGTGQALTVYTEFIAGPRAAGKTEGPEEMHVIFVDNGRSEVLASDCREILRCIRCGACMNVCPVYRQASGHAYRSVYPGPVGAVLSPLLAGKNFPAMADLPKASSLCGACNEVCPVDIPIPDLLLRLRDRAKREGAPTVAAAPMGPFALLATHPAAWRMAMRAGSVMNVLPPEWIPAGLAKAWTRTRTVPEWRGGQFRRWWRDRQKTTAAANEKPQINAD